MNSKALINFLHLTTRFFLLFAAFFVVTFYSESSAFSQISTEHKEKLKFQLIYETLKPIELESGTLYFLDSKKSFKPKDSAVFYLTPSIVLPDSIAFEKKWRYGNYLKLKLSFKNRKYTSNTIAFSGENAFWDVSSIIGE